MHIKQKDKKLAVIIARNSGQIKKIVNKINKLPCFHEKK